MTLQLPSASLAAVTILGLALKDMDHRYLVPAPKSTLGRNVLSW